MAFGPVNTGGGASGRTLETIYKSIAEVRREAAPRGRPCLKGFQSCGCVPMPQPLRLRRSGRYLH